MHGSMNDLDRARDALQHIDPAIPRSDWIKVGMAAHAAGLDFADFDSWSSTADSYDAKDCRSAWRSFKASHIGAGTLFYIAREHGWNGGDGGTHDAIVQVDFSALLKSAQERRQQEQDERNMNAGRMRSMWQGAREVAQGDPVQRYLAGRGLALPEPESLRFHPALPYFDDGVRSVHPAMLANVTTAQGFTVALHRTYLAPDGGKASVGTAKKLTPTCGPLAGSSIKLGSPTLHKGRVALGVAEGIETAIAAAMLTGIPVWSCVSAAVLAQFVPPQQVQALYIFADNDESGTGQKAAEKLARRCCAAGLSVRTLTPKTTGTDWADELIARRATV